ncbi:MAG: glycosyltransferase [Chitinophagaceae bacterium]
MKALFIYNYFYPAFKAGGPVQSLHNLVKLLASKLEVNIYTSCFDLNDKLPLGNVVSDQWVPLVFSKNEDKIQVFYSKKTSFKSVISDRCFECVYLNGIFGYEFFLEPFVWAKRNNKRIVIAPRGMLQRGALASKFLKKLIYLKLLKYSGLLNGVIWHATDNTEAADIEAYVGKGATIEIVPNIPKPPVYTVQNNTKDFFKLRLVYISLVSEKKNLLTSIEAVIRTKSNVSLDIYGPIKDADYWNKCLRLIKENPRRIAYKGDVLPEKVQNVFSLYDASLFLTKGENFGHALYECLSVGRPLITSYYTPWNDLKNHKAGWNINIHDSIDAISQILDSIAALDAEEFSDYCNGAHMLAVKHYEELDPMEKYLKLFGNHS